MICLQIEANQQTLAIHWFQVMFLPWFFFLHLRMAKNRDPTQRAQNANKNLGSGTIETPPPQTLNRLCATCEGVKGWEKLLPRG